MSNDNSSYSPNNWPTTGTQVSAPMIPPGGGNTGGLTHYAKYGHGGYRSVETMSELNTLALSCLELGMMVNVINDDNVNNNGLWILDSIDGTNRNWKKLDINSDELNIGNDAQTTTSEDDITTITTLGSSEVVAGTKNEVADKGWFVDAVYPVYENDKWVAYVHLSKTYPKTSSSYKEESAIPTFDNLDKFIKYCETKDTEIFTESFTKLQDLVTSNGGYNNVLLNWVPREGSRSVFETDTSGLGKVIYPSSKLVDAHSSYTSISEKFIKNTEYLNAQCNGCLKLEAPDSYISKDTEPTGYNNQKLNVIKVSANKDKQFLNKLATYKAQFTYSPDTYYDIPNYFFAYIQAYAKDTSGNITGPFPPAYSTLVDKKGQPQFFKVIDRLIPNAKTIFVLGNTNNIGDLQIFTDNYAFGVENKLAGTSALTIGKTNKSYQSFGLTVGAGNTNTGYASVAIGNSNNVSSEAGAAIGFRNNAYSLGAIALGRENSAGDPNNLGTLFPSVALGYQSSSFAKGGIVAGLGLKSGTNNTPATDGQAVFGRFNKNNLNNLLEVGVGESNTNRKNALEIDTNSNLILSGNTTIINDNKVKNSLLPCNFSGWYFSGFGGSAVRMFLTNVQLTYKELEIIFNETTRTATKITFDSTKDSHKELFEKIKKSKITNVPKQGPFFINEFTGDIVPLLSDFNSSLGSLQLPTKFQSGLKFRDEDNNIIDLKPKTETVQVSNEYYTITNFVSVDNETVKIIECNYTNIGTWAPRYEQTKKGVFLDAKDNKIYTFYTGNVLNFKLFVGPNFKTDVCNIKTNDTFSNQVPTVTYECGNEKPVKIPMGYSYISNLSTTQTIKLQDSIDLFTSGDIADKPFMYGLYIDNVTSYRYYADGTNESSTLPTVVNLFRNYSDNSFLNISSEISDTFIKTEKQSTLEIGSDFIDKPDRNSNEVTVNKLSATQYGFRFASKIKNNKNDTYSVAITSNVAQVPNDSNGNAILAESPDKVYVAGFKCGLSVGDRLTIKNHSLMQDCVTITKVDGNIITYKINSDYPYTSYIKYIDGTEYATDTSNPKNFHDLCLWCPLKPDEGYVLISENAISTGIGNKVSASSAFVTGRENTVYGDYSIAAGRNNSVGYASISVGQQVSTKYYNNCAAFGRGLQVGHSNQTIVGQYNIVDKDSNYFAVGNGTDANNRSNAFEVTTTGLTKANNGLEITKGNLQITNGYLNMRVFKYNDDGSTSPTSNYASVKLIAYDNDKTDDDLVLNIVDVQTISTLAGNATVNDSIKMNVYRNNGESTNQTASLQCVQLGEGNDAQYSLRIFR